jgi:hypothetical protein
MDDELYLALELAIDDNDEYLVNICEDAATHFVRSYTDADDGKDEGAKARVSLRYLDLLRERLRKGQITQKYYDEQYEKIKAKNKTLEYLPKSGTSSYKTGARPSKEKAPMKPEEFITATGSKDDIKNYRRNDKVDSVTGEKIKRHVDIINTTDDYGEYKNHYDALSKLVGLSKDKKRAGALVNPSYSVNKQNDGTYKVQLIRRLDDNPEVDKKKTSGKDLVHVTDKKNEFKLLKPTFRSSDGTLYASKRAYFGLDSVAGRNGGNSDTVPDDKNAYAYTAKDTDNIMYDPELHGGKAVFVQTDKPLAVKKLKSGTKINKEKK